MVNDKKKLINRLKRIEGQVKGIEKMIEDEKFCGDIITQITAAKSALNSVGGLVLENYTKECIKNKLEYEDPEKTIDELIDRFGEPPLEVMRLVNTARLKHLAVELNINLIKEEGAKVKCQFINSEVVDGSKLVKFSKKYRRKIKIKSAKKPQLLIKIKDPENIDKQLLKMLKDLKNI